MSQKSKCSVAVYSSTGRSFTTRRGARRLESRGLADRRPDGGLQMRESDHRFACAPREAQNSPAIEVQLKDYLPVLEPHGFLPYPHQIQTSSGELRRAA